MMAAAPDLPRPEQARLAVELSELVRWPGVVRFESLAELLDRLVDLHRRPATREAAVAAMRRFNAEARSEAARLWPRVLRSLAADASPPGGVPALQLATRRGADADPAPATEAGAARVSAAHHRASRGGGCGFPVPLPASAETPLKVGHRRLVGLVAALEGPLRWRLGLRYSLGFGTLLGAARHGGPIPHDHDLDIHVGRLRPGSPEDLRRERSRGGQARLCRRVRALVRCQPRGRHRVAVDCSGSRSGRASRAAHTASLAAGELPYCNAALGMFRDPWYDSDWVGEFEADPSPVRLVWKAAGRQCFPPWLDIYASTAVLQDFGPTCRCRYDGIWARCLSGWDAYLRAEYGDDYMQPRLSPPEDAPPCVPRA